MATVSVKNVTIKSIADFAKNVESLLGSATEGNWYRGVGNSSHGLKPALYRHTVINDLEGLLRLEAKMLQEFERNSILQSEPISGEGEDGRFRMLFYMQHYGIPTRLLDWSTNPFIALYFALTSSRVDNAGNPLSDAAVWVLNPKLWNERALAHVSYGEQGAMVHSDALVGYSPRRVFNGRFEPTAMLALNEHPACILGVANNARMFAQKGVFTIFGRDLNGMETQFQDKHFPNKSLIKMIIPRANVKDLLSLLLRMGYTDSVSYPDLQGLAMEIRRTNGFPA